MTETAFIASFFEEEHQFHKGILRLREILTDTGLVETWKWGAPVYTLNGKNVAGIARFKNHFGIWFFNGSLLKDTEKALYNAQPGKTASLRQMRYHSETEIDQQLLRDYLQEAIANEKKGISIKRKSTKATLVLPPELKNSFKADTKLEALFYKLSNGKQREYAEYLGSAKQEATRLKRLEKIIPLIIEGKGLNDQYK